MSAETEPGAAPTMPITQLSAIKRRVIGVLIEKAFTVHDSYPMTANALTAGCNQRTARDPVTNYPIDQVDEALLELQKQGLVIRVIAATGRTERWKHNLKDCWGLDRPHRAVLAELLLRGPATEGELRGNASRMVPIESLDELRGILDQMAQAGFVRRLSPDTARRGVTWCHLLYPPADLEKVEARFADHEMASSRAPETPTVVAATTSSSPPSNESLPAIVRRERAPVALEDLKVLVDRLQQEVIDIREELRQLKATRGT